MLNFFKTLLAIAFLSVSLSCNADKTKMPVMIGGNGDLDACLSVGIVTGLKTGGDGFLAVRSGAGSQYLLIDKLKQEQQVFVCSNSADGQWLGIVYDVTNKLDCGVGTPINPSQPYQGKCKSGWVSQRWITITAG